MLTGHTFIFSANKDQANITITREARYKVSKKLNTLRSRPSAGRGVHDTQVHSGHRCSCGSRQRAYWGRGVLPGGVAGREGVGVGGGWRPWDPHLGEISSAWGTGR